MAQPRNFIVFAITTIALSYIAVLIPKPWKDKVVVAPDPLSQQVGSLKPKYPKTSKSSGELNTSHSMEFTLYQQSLTVQLNEGEVLQPIGLNVPFSIRSDSNGLLISAIVHSLDGKVIAKIYDNEWVLNQNNYFRKNFDSSALEVIDEYDIPVLQIEYLDESTIKIGGIFYTEEKETLEIYPDFPSVPKGKARIVPFALGGQGIIIIGTTGYVMCSRNTSPNELRMKARIIKPWFDYSKPKKLGIRKYDEPSDSEKLNELGKSSAEILTAINSPKKTIDENHYLSSAFSTDEINSMRFTNEEYNSYKKLAEDTDSIIANISNFDMSSSDKANIYFYIANLKSILNNHKEAVLEYKRAISLNPNDARYFNNMGTAFSKLGNVKEAEENYLKAISLAPSEALYYRNLIRALIIQNKIKNAKIYAEKSYELDRNNLYALNILGVVFAENKDYEKAKEWYAKALSLFPDEPSTFYNLGKLSMIELDFPEAETRFKQAIEKDRRYLSAYVALANLYKEIGKLKKAIEYYELGLKVDPQLDSDLFYNYGVFLLEQGNIKEAIEKFEQAIKINPNDAEAFNNWGVSLKRLGKIEDSIDKFEKAASIDPRNAKIYYNWGNALGVLNRQKSVIEKYETFLKISNGQHPAEESKARKYLNQLKNKKKED